MGVQVLHLKSPIQVLAPTPAVFVSPDLPLAEACRIMRAEHVSAVIVGPGAAGILTERDVARAMAAECSATTPVHEVATFFPVMVDADVDVVTAAATMLNEGVRHLLVANGDGQLGIVSMRTLLAALVQAAQPELWLTSLRMHIQVPG